MIIGTSSEMATYAGIIPDMDIIHDFVKAGNLPEVGKWIVLSEKIRVIRLSDWNREHEHFEAHHSHFDLHFTLNGMDALYIALGYEKMVNVLAYDAVSDYALFAGRSDVSIDLRPGNWAYISPNEPHRNKFTEAGTEKLVFKIKI